MEEKNLSKV